MKPTRVFPKLDAMMALMTTSNSPFSTAAVFVAAGAWRRVSKEFYKMKRALICALLAVAVTCCGVALYAQDSMSQGGGPQHRMAMSPEQRLQHMTKALSLTDDQQQKIKPILDGESQQMQTVRQDSSLSQQDKWSKMEQIRTGTTSQINSILTPDQQKKYEEMSKHHGPPPQAGGQMSQPPAPPQ
jgi:protein CpxP